MDHGLVPEKKAELIAYRLNTTGVITQLQSLTHVERLEDHVPNFPRRSDCPKCAKMKGPVGNMAEQRTSDLCITSCHLNSVTSVTSETA
jgi:hypothetical protein